MVDGYNERMKYPENDTFLTAKLTHTDLELKPGLRDKSLAHNPFNPVKN
jgi:hypothetical protein